MEDEREDDRIARGLNVSYGYESCKGFNVVHFIFQGMNP